MKRFLFFALLMLLAFAACHDKNRVSVPDPLLTESQMIDLMTDTYLIEAVLNQKKSAGVDVTQLQQAYYDQLFEHYGITDSIFEANMDYYSHDLETLERIMDSVTTRFTKAQ